VFLQQLQVSFSVFLHLSLSVGGSTHLPFTIVFCIFTATIVAGTLAERCQMNAYLYYSMMLTGFGKSSLI